LNIPGECFEDGTRPLLEGVKSVEAFDPGEWITALVEHCDLAPADQKTPFAPNAVVKSGFTLRQRAVAHRTDHKLVPKASVAALGSVVNAISPKLHEKTLGAFFGPDGRAAQSKAKQVTSVMPALKSCCKTTCEIAF
jgi:hypothetical protein